MRRMGVDLATGEVKYEFTSGQLEGSYDHRISLRVERARWVSPPPTVVRVVWDPKKGKKVDRNSRRVPVLEPCAPFVVLEGSVHKALLGHNVEGGPRDFVAACRWFVAEVGHLAGVFLPDGAEWTVQRVDWAEVYGLGAFAVVQEYLGSLNLAHYPRRKAVRYGDESFMVSGDTTALKAYHKGPEFSKHDFKRIRVSAGEAIAVQLQESANAVLRTETELRSTRLGRDFGHPPLVREITPEYLDKVHDQEWRRLLKEGSQDMKIVRTHRAVNRRLREIYADELANRLFGTWMQLSTLGEREVRGFMKHSTFYDQRKQLQVAGVSWEGADVRIIAQAHLVPEDFTPQRSDPRRLIDQAPAVTSALAAYQLAA